MVPDWYNNINNTVLKLLNWLINLCDLKLWVGKGGGHLKRGDDNMGEGMIQQGCPI